ncbi:Proline oxidase [Phaffia rhodozyma]|uniref:Proline dehydrogenase n=1 Tax=Phaffia rhodozyma TaxID=264483 RepID=A0A0F7SP95_PHARH|nr:Proline oxidase [Phaffia rhodozyma]
MSRLASLGSIRAGKVLAPITTVGILLAYKAQSENAVQAEQIVKPWSTPPVDSQLRSTPTSQLVNSWFVYTCCKIPWVVDNSPAILSTLSQIPVVSSLTMFAVKHTFFAQFVGGETAFDCLPTIRQLRRNQIGTLLNYSVEVSDEESHDQTDKPADSPEGQRKLQASRIEAEKKIAQTVNSIEVCGYEASLARKNNEHDIGSSWIALKFSGLMADPTVLERASNTILALRAAQPDATSSTYYPGTPTDRELELMTAKGNTTLILPNISNGVSTSDLEALRLLHKDMRTILNKARHSGVRVIIDAEYSWYQPAIDAFQTILSLEYNKTPSQPSSSLLGSTSTTGSFSSSWIGKLGFELPSSSTKNADTVEIPVTAESWPNVQPLVYGTYQAYLRRNPEHMRHSYIHAKANGYSLGVKLVRGAYHGVESDRWRQHPVYASTGPEPVWQQKPETDDCFDSGLDWLLDHVQSDVASGTAVPTVGVIIASHNQESCAKVIAGLVDRKLAVGQVGPDGKTLLSVSQAVRDRVSMGQLYGMCDALTSSIANTFVPEGSPLVLKYVPWGGLQDVMPYLGRRAIENKTVLKGEGGASAETSRITRELKRRWFGIE